MSGAEAFANALDAALVEPYRPANEFEGEIFFAGWCCRCARDRAMSEGVPVDECAADELCEIIIASYRLDVDDPDYPREWRNDENGNPCCTAFVPAGEPIPQVFRDSKTIDLFEEMTP